MTTQTITYYTIGSYREPLGNNVDLNFVSRELANEHIIKELTPQNWTPHVELSNLTISKKEKVWVDRSYPVYYKDKKKGIKKYVSERVEEDKFTVTHDFNGYVNFEYKWREQVNGWSNNKPAGYYVFKTGEVAHEITESGVLFKAPVYVQFVKAELVVTPEIKMDGQPYQALKEEVKREVVSEWLPVYVSGGSQYNPTKYVIDPNWSDGYWGAARELYFAAIEYYVNENKIEVITEL
jgi:hypothetical protein